MLRGSMADVPTLSAAILAGVLGFGTILTVQAPSATAYDDDVDVVCFDYEVNGQSETECQTIEQLTAECALADPEYTSDVCQGLLESRRPLGLTTTNKHRRDDNGGRGDRGRDSGRDSGGGRSGANGAGGSSGGSGPNG